jgi:DNA-binding NtrC family response regulator
MTVKTISGRVLLVDDDPDFVEILSEVMKQRGLEVVMTRNGEEAFSEFLRTSFDLVITDLKMPKMDGLTLLKAIKNKDRDATVLVITGFGTVESAVSAIKEGAYDYITKSIGIEDLGLTVNRALDKRNLIKQVNTLKGIFVAALISIPVWLALGVIIGWLWK